MLIWYLFVKEYVPYWAYITYPITLFVTFLHEFWHSFFALLTGGWVKSLMINSDGSWLATTYGWIRPIIIMGWYIGSAIFWWLLLSIWNRHPWVSKYIMSILIFLLVFSAIFWFSTITSSLIQIAFAIALYFVNLKCSPYVPYIISFLWISSLYRIIEDFNVWPTSDIASFSFLLPQTVWMYIWLIIVLAITYASVKYSTSK